jgi:hypothetical protein
MKKAPAFVFGLLLLLLLTAASIAVGATKGYQQEKAQVESTMASLDALFSSRVETGYNLLTVARRHLSKDEALLKAVEVDILDLSSQGQWQRKVEANAHLETNAKDLLKALEQAPGVQADARDLGYVTGLLPQALDQSAQWADAAGYNQAAKAYNERLNSSITGRIAKMLGVTEAALFLPEGRL